MAAATCPDCGSAELYRSALNTPANGLFGPTLLPGSSSGRFRVVVCKDCGLTSFFASTVDVQDLGEPHWSKIEDGVLGRPLGLEE